MAADPEPGFPPLGPERSRESLPDESLHLDERAVESPARDDSRDSREVDDENTERTRERVVTSATPSRGSSVIDAVVNAAVDASMEAEEADVSLFPEHGDVDARAPRAPYESSVSSDAEPTAPPPPRERDRTPSPPTPRRPAGAPREAKENTAHSAEGAAVDVAAANGDDAKITRRSNPLTLEALFEIVGGSEPKDVTFVDATDRAYDSVDAEALLLVAPFLERFVAPENFFSSSDVVSMAATLQNVKRLDVCCNAIDDTFRVPFPNHGPCFASLTVLNARSNNLGPNAFAELGKLPSLEKLDVSSNAIFSLSALHASDESPFRDASSVEFFPKLTHLDVSAQTPKLRSDLRQLKKALGSCPRLRALVAKGNAISFHNNEDVVLTPGIDFPSLRALDLRDNALIDPAGVMPLCALATRGERRVRRGVSDVGVAGGGRDDGDADEGTSSSFDVKNETFVFDHHRTTKFASTVSSFGSVNDPFADDDLNFNSSSFGATEVTNERTTKGGRLEEVALGGNHCAAALLRLAETVGRTSGGTVDVASTRHRPTPRERLDKALASRSVLFRGVYPPTRYGGASALAAPMHVLRALFSATRTSPFGEDGRVPGVIPRKPLFGSEDENGFSFGPERRAVFTLVDGGADGVFPFARERLEMRRMATASDARAAHATATKLAFDFEARVPSALGFGSEPDDGTFFIRETSNAAAAAAARLDARLEIDTRKDFNRKYAESKGIVGETRARARAMIDARSKRTLGRVVDDDR
jgi:hypothetical protein